MSMGCGGGAKTLATPVDSLATGFDLEAYRRRRMAAVRGTMRDYLHDCLPCEGLSQRPLKPVPLQPAPLLGVMERLVVPDHMPKVIHPLTGQRVQYCLNLVDQTSQ